VATIAVTVVHHRVQTYEIPDDVAPTPELAEAFVRRMLGPETDGQNGYTVQSVAAAGVPAVTAAAEPAKPGPIHSVVFSDDGALAAEFDARRWFVQATAQEICAMADAGWSGRHPADDLARYMEGRDDGVAQVMEYVRDSMEAGDPVGFTCQVTGDAAEVWLRHHRTDVWRMLHQSNGGRYAEDTRRAGVDVRDRDRHAGGGRRGRDYEAGAGDRSVPPRPSDRPNVRDRRRY
jgi:hypothetical protein